MPGPAFAKSRLRRTKHAAKSSFRFPSSNPEFSKSIRPSSRGRAAFAVSTTLADWGEWIKLAGSTDLAQACEPGLLEPG